MPRHGGGWKQNPSDPLPEGINSSWEQTKVRFVWELLEEYHLGPTGGSVLTASPRLETLEAGGCYLDPGDSSAQAQIPLVRLPALKHLAFAWVYVDEAYNLFTMFQIPETLETLCLASRVSSLEDGAKWGPATSLTGA